MRALWRDRALTGIMILGLAALFACGGSGGGTSAIPPGDEPPPGNGEPPPGNGQPPPAPLVPANDAYTWTGNTRLTVAAANGVLANDPAGTVIAAADATTALGGTVTVNTATGAFTYDPPVGAQNAADTFGYTVAGFDPLTVTVNLEERVWYVDNTQPAGGNGTLGSPFNTLAAAQAPVSDANDTIFVFTGAPLAPTDAGQNLGIALAAGQKLLGQGRGLRFNGVPIVDPLPNAPVISTAGFPNGAAAGDTPVVLLDGQAGGNEVAGFTIRAAFNEGILAPSGTGHHLHENTITFDAANGREGIRLLSVTGANLVVGNTITGSPRDGIKLANNENQAGDPVAAVPVTATVTMSRNAITGSAQDGIAVILDGAGTAVTLNVLANTIAGSGAAGANEGINIDSLGAASVTAVVSRNTVSGSAGEGIDQGAAGTSAVAAFVANNDLSGNGGLAQFRGRTAAAGAAFCLELINNVNAARNSTFLVDNNGGVFELFEPLATDPQANDAPAVRNPPGPFTNVAQGTCAVPLDGAALFEANCTVCHTGNGMGLETPKLLIARDITGRTAAQITEQFTINGSMALIFLDNGRFKLTPQEVEAIAAALAVAP